jgi:hypothetical protein
VDVSFISLSLILPAAAAVLKPDGQMVCLVKPQFEAGREKVGKKGVVRDPAFTGTWWWPAAGMPNAMGLPCAPFLVTHPRPGGQHRVPDVVVEIGGGRH